MSSRLIQKIFKPSERGKMWRSFMLILVLAIGAMLIDGGVYFNKGVDKLANVTNDAIVIPHVGELDFRLGLDLQGGSHLVYKADVTAVDPKDRNDAVEGVRDVIERRVNGFGVSEPLVQTNNSQGEYRIIVELAGIKDVNEAIKMIGETPILEFKEQNNEISELSDEERSSLESMNITAKENIDVAMKRISDGDSFETVTRDYGEDNATKESGGDLGWLSKHERPDIIGSVELLEVGGNTDILTTGDGYEIFKLEELREKKNPFNEEETETGEVKARHILICHSESERCESERTKEEAETFAGEVRGKATAENFEELAKEFSDEPGADEQGGDLGWFYRGMMVPPFESVAFVQEVGTVSDVVETQFGYHIIFVEDTKPAVEYRVRRLFIDIKTEEDITGPKLDWKNTELTGKHLDRAVVVFDPNDNTPQISLQFDGEGSDLFADITERNIGNPVAIFLDGYAISVPTVREKIPSGQAVISGTFNILEAKLLAQRLNAGALPVPIEIINQQTVGASLGHESLLASLKAGLIGLILVAVFMILYYRLPGIMAVFSLIVYGLLVLALFKVVSVTLTLAGLAGFILSIGMAVDANVLIFERLKEELRIGNPIRIAIDEAFIRAWPSIRDGNFSTLITCFILFQFSSGVVKGFAITLILGVIVSMFSAIVITKNFMMVVSGEWLEKRKWILGVNNKKNNL